MYAGVACTCCMGHNMVVIPTLSPYLFTSSSLHFYLIFSKFLNKIMLVCSLFVYFFDGLWPFQMIQLICHHQHQHSLSHLQFCVFSIPLQAHHQEPKRKAASLNCGSYMYSTEPSSWGFMWLLSAQDRLSIPQDTELKASYISLAPNDERPHPNYDSVEVLSSLAPATPPEAGPLRI